MIETKEDIRLVYDILCDNLKKFDAVPVHSLSELWKFKGKRTIK